VWSIADRLWQIGHAGATGDPAPTLRVVATAEGLDVFANDVRAATVRVDTHLFDARTLRPLVDGLAGEVVAHRASGDAGADAASAQLLDRLQTPTLDVLIVEDRRVSAALIAQPGRRRCTTRRRCCSAPWRCGKRPMSSRTSARYWRE
jgi:hypothetical protein